MFTSANEFGGRYRLCVVSADGDGVTTSAGTRLSADMSIEDAHAISDVLVIPGGPDWDRMIRRAGISSRHVTRLFCDEVGTTPARYIEQIRLEAAQAMLETGDDPVAVIARRAGFGSPESLRRAFVRQLGVTPSAFRASFRTTAWQPGTRLRSGCPEPWRRASTCRDRPSGCRAPLAPAVAASGE